MKYLFTLFLSALFLASCSGSSDIVESSKPTAEDAVASTEIDPEKDEEGTELNGDEKDTATESDDNETAGINQKNVKLSVENQTTAGQITVKEVATSRDGWLSVHRANNDGGIVLPDSIGEARVDSGDSEDVVIDLWEAPAIDEKLWVLLHIDAGERGKYEFPGKDAPVKKNGETVARSLVIQDPNTEEDEDE